MLFMESTNLEFLTINFQKAEAIEYHIDRIYKSRLIDHIVLNTTPEAVWYNAKIESLNLDFLNL